MLLLSNKQQTRNEKPVEIHGLFLSHPSVAHITNAPWALMIYTHRLKVQPSPVVSEGKTAKLFCQRQVTLHGEEAAEA